MALIEILNGPEAGRTVELGAGTHVLGRAAAVDLTIVGNAVSGRHLELQVAEDGTVRFRDLGSTNGTWSGGVKVDEGEWFPGSELKLGNALLRLGGGAAAPAEAGEAAGEDSAIHRRAMDAAMAGERRGGAWKLLLVVVALAAAGGAYYYFNRPAEQTPSSASAQAGGSRPARTSDLLGGLGSFTAESAGAWELESGLTLADGALRNGEGMRRAQLAKRIPHTGGSVELRAETEGCRVWPLVGWGFDEEGPVFTTWIGGGLDEGRVSLALPEQAAWFRVALLVDGAGSVRELKAEPGEHAAARSSHDARDYVAFGGNLTLLHRDGSHLLTVAATGGEWTPGEGGFDSAGDAGSLWVHTGAKLNEAGPFLIFSEGGPLAPAPGVVVEGSPGLLIGGEATRYWLRFEEPRRVVALDGGVLVADPGPVQLRWKLDEAFAEAKRLAREIERLAREGDSAAVLARTDVLLRDWPFDEADIERALELRRDTIVAGREELAEIEVAAQEALFFEALQDVSAVSARASALADSLPGTDVAREAGELAAVLDEAARRMVQSGQEDRERYRGRLMGALAQAFPVIAGWLQSKEASGS